MLHTAGNYFCNFCTLLSLLSIFYSWLKKSTQLLQTFLKHRLVLKPFNQSFTNTAIHTASNLEFYIVKTNAMILNYSLADQTGRQCIWTMLKKKTLNVCCSEINARILIKKSLLFSFPCKDSVQSNSCYKAQM